MLVSTASHADRHVPWLGSCYSLTSLQRYLLGVPRPRFKRCATNALCHLAGRTASSQRGTQPSKTFLVAANMLWCSYGPSLPLPSSTTTTASLHP